VALGGVGEVEFVPLGAGPQVGAYLLTFAGGLARHWASIFSASARPARLRGRLLLLLARGGPLLLAGRFVQPRQCAGGPGPGRLPLRGCGFGACLLDRTIGPPNGSIAKNRRIIDPPRLSPSTPP
jgi:hypothetical protein